MTQANVLLDIDTQINTNGVQAITGAVANSVLRNMYLNTYSAEIGVSLLPTVLSPTITSSDDLKTILARIQLGASTGTNGVTSISGSLGLGGDLVQNTTIPGELFNLYLGDESSSSPLGFFSVYSKNGMSFRNYDSASLDLISMQFAGGVTLVYSNTTVHSEGWSVLPNVVTLEANVTGGGVKFGLNSLGQTITNNGVNNGIVITDTLFSKGAVYPADYSANFTPESLITKRYAENNYVISGSDNLNHVLSNGNDTGNVDITSVDTCSILSIVDGISKMSYSAHGNTGKFQTDDNGSVMDWSNGVIVAAITHSVADTTYAHNVKNKFISPVNDFGTVQIYTGRVQLATSNRVTWSSTLGGSPYIVGTTSVTSKSINIDATHNSSSYTRLMQVASTTQAYISIQSNIIAAWPLSEVRVDGFNKSVLIDAPGVINIGTTNSTIINYGNASTVHNFLGTAIYELQVNSYVQDKLMTLNYGGSVGSAIGVGFEIEENNVITGYFKTNSARNGFSILTPAVAYKADINLNLLTADKVFSLPNNSGTIALTSDIDNLIKRVTFGDADYTMLIDDRVISSSVTLTAPRTIALVSGLSAGQSVIILDDFQAINSTNTLTITVPTGKKLNGVVNGTETIETTGGGRILYADGSDNFTFDNGIVRKTKVQTLTNKTITQRVTTIVSSATPTPNADTTDEYTITALASAALLTNPTGTPTEGQTLLVRIKDNGTARALTFDTLYRFSSNQPAPTTTVIGKTIYLGFVYNFDDTKWDCLGYINNI